MKGLTGCIVIGVLLLTASAAITPHVRPGNMESITSHLRSDSPGSLRPLVHPGSSSSVIPDVRLIWLMGQSDGFAASVRALETAVGALDGRRPASITIARNALRECRLHYKRIGFFLEYFFPDEAAFFNEPPDPEVDEVNLRSKDAEGMQVIEALLYDKDPANEKDSISRQVHGMAVSAAGIPALLAKSRVNGGQWLESVRLELIRIMTLYITGYDAPLLKSGIAEAGESLRAIDTVLAPYMITYSQKDSLLYYLGKSGRYIKASGGFNSFNRLSFLTDDILPLQRQLHRLAREKSMDLNTAPVLNPAARDLFSPDAFNKAAFPNAGDPADSSQTALGRHLFFENALSGDYSRSCGSCHSPAAYFTDGLSRNTTLDGKELLPRNSPSLLYSCYQYSQFWDGRAGGLEGQITTVLKNKKEMDGNDDSIVSRLRKDPYYKQHAPGIDIGQVRRAIAAYIQTLTPFNSPFDRYMQGNHTALSVAQQRGFNLFMGKALCGTCHFAPVFNGLTPPLYKETEYEVLGTTAGDDLRKPRPDADKGRYVFFPVPSYEGAFKTPSVRNAAVTGPYMHNGGFGSLEKVISFYNKGGGAGLGLGIPEQTLSPAGLQLSKREQSDIVAFITALTDSRP